MTRLAGKVAVITGGAGGIGQAAGRIFAEEGASVLLVDVNESALQQVVADIDNDNVSYEIADVSQPDDVQRYVQTAIDRFGGLDVFLNNAGIEGNITPLVDYPIDVFDKVLAVNIRGAWLGLKYVIPEMEKRGGGSIVITSSTAGINGYPGLSAYVTTKHAVIGLMRSAALECARLGIRVNTVNPCPTETRMMRSIEDQTAPGSGDLAKQAVLEGIPLNRYGLPEEVARLMLFLASDESQFCTGGVYMIDGGVSAGPTSRARHRLIEAQASEAPTK